MYDTGGRIQEILDLRTKDFFFDFDTPLVYLNGKGNKVRAVPLMDKTIQHLKEYLRLFHPQDRNEYLFYTVIKGKKGAMSPDNVSAFLQKYADQARVNFPEIPSNIHAHLFRHSRAMHLFQSGIPHLWTVRTVRNLATSFGREPTHIPTNRFKRQLPRRDSATRSHRMQ